MHGLNLGITATVSAKALLYGTIDHEQNKLIYISIVPYPNPLLTTTSQVLALCVMTRVRLCKTFYVTLDLPGLLWEFQSVQSLSRVQLFATP